MTVQFNPRTGGRGIEWCIETRNAIGGCMHECRWQMPDGSVAICYAEQFAERVVTNRPRISRNVHMSALCKILRRWLS